MIASENLTDAGRRWRAAADELLSEAERIGPLEEGAFGELGTDDEGQAAAGQIDDTVERLLAEGDDVLSELLQAEELSADARFQATSLLVGTLALGEALSVAGQSPEDVFGELRYESAQTTTFADARATVTEVAAIVEVPKSVEEALSKVQTAGATETWRVLEGSVGKLAGGALVAGLEGVLKGTAAAAFDAVREQLGRWRDTLKRGAVRIASWVVDNLKALLPKPLRGRLDEAVDWIQEQVDANVGAIAADAYGLIPIQGVVGA